jgi:hypothetical protein
MGIDISPTACRVMAKRLRDVCALPESEPLWRAGRGFVVRDLPWTVEKLRIIPPFEFENWAVIAFGTSPTRCRRATWAWMAASSPSLTIAQPFMAGFTVRNRWKSRPGRKNLAHAHHCLPSLTGLGRLGCDIPSHKWLGYFPE